MPFIEGASVSTGGVPLRVEVGDLDGDGNLDLIASSLDAGNVQLFYGDGAGGFSSGASFSTSGRGVAALDVDGDGDIDIVSGDTGANALVFLNDGSGGFSQSAFAAAAQVADAAAADLDGDGVLDLVTVNDSPGNVTVLLGSGAGAFGAPAAFGAVGSARSLVLADFNGDGELDAVVAGFTQSLALLTGNGDGTFDAPVGIAAANGTTTVVAGDFNGDGDMDIAYTRDNAEVVAVRLGDGLGGFSAPTDYGGGPGGHTNSIAVADLTADGVLDLVFTSENGGVRLLTGLGDGTFSGATVADFADDTTSIGFGDFDGDGWTDMVVARGSAEFLTLLLSRAGLDIAADAASRAEGGGGTTAFTFTVTRSGGSLASTASANWAVTGSVDGADFVGGVLPSGVVNFGVGQSTATITVNVAGDADAELSESFTVTLSGATDAVVVTAAAQATITDDDTRAAPPPTAGSSGDDLAVLDGQGTSYSAGDGNDEVFAMDGDDWVHGNAGNDYVNGGGGDDIAYGGKGDDQVLGESGDDRLFGDAGNDKVNGGPGSDTCEGGEGDDQVRGGQGDDWVLGGGGNDFVSGDRGNDVLSGGAGADLFHIFAGAGSDGVTDFNRAEGDQVWVAAGSTWTLAQSGSDTVVTLSDGTTLTLAGVTASSLDSGWIFSA